MTELNNIGYPTISEKAWWTIREKFKASIPSVVSPTYVKSLLSLANDNSANSNVITPMKRLGLIDEENKPTSLANNWRIDEKYTEACKTMLNSVYPSELLDLFPDDSIDKNSARTWFMSQGVGQAAADKMIALFTLLKSGEIKSKKTDNTAKKTKVQKKDTKATQQKSHEGAVNPIQSPAENILPTNQAPCSNKPNLHIDLQIHISPDSTPEQIECIFSSMAKHLYGADNK